MIYDGSVLMKTTIWKHGFPTRAILPCVKCYICERKKCWTSPKSALGGGKLKTKFTHHCVLFCPDFSRHKTESYRSVNLSSWLNGSLAMSSHVPQMCIIQTDVFPFCNRCPLKHTHHMQKSHCPQPCFSVTATWTKGQIPFWLILIYGLQ